MMLGGARKRTTRPTPSPMMSELDKYRGVGFDERVASSPVAEFASELAQVHNALMTNGAVSTKDAVFADVLKSVDAKKIKGGRMAIYRMLMADSAFFAYKSPTSRRTKYTGHVFATAAFLDKYGVQVSGNEDIKEGAMKNGILRWSDIKPQSPTRKLIVQGLVDCCTIKQRQGKKKKPYKTPDNSPAINTVQPNTLNEKLSKIPLGKFMKSRFSVSPSPKMVKTAWGEPTQPTMKTLPPFTRKDLSPIDLRVNNTKATGNYGSDILRRTIRA